MAKRGGTLVFGLALVALGCSGGGGKPLTGAGGTGGGAGSTGAAGSIAAAGAGGGATAGTGVAGAAAGTSGAAGAAAGTTGTAGAGAAGTGAAGTGVAGTGAAGTGAAGVGAAGSGAGGLPALPDPAELMKVKPTAGCGKDVTQAKATFVKYTIQTSGTKPTGCADSRCGAWTYARDYYVWLPADYDKQHAYPLVFQGPGCGGNGTNVYSLSPTNDTTGVGVGGSVIRVGLTPSVDAQMFHATNPNQGCFDDKEGDDSVEWPFYEGVIDALKATVCYDQNRVFATGNASGSILAQELACKYAGDARGYAIRGFAVNEGTFPTDARYTPTCSNLPSAALIVAHRNDGGHPIPPYIAGARHAVIVNRCSDTYTFDTNTLDPYPIGNGNPSTTCGTVKGCAAGFPVVLCLIPGQGYASNDAIFNPAAATLIKSFAPP